MTDDHGTAFDRDQFDAIYPPGVERHYWNICRDRMIAGHLRAAGVEGPMLEVGCGRGLVVAGLRRMGFDLRGVERAKVDVVPAAAGHVTTGIDALLLDAEQRATIRTILLLDVIEHIADPVGFIAGLRQAYPALRWMVYTVPARQELFSNYDRFNRHFRRYDRATLRAHITTGIKDHIRIAYFFHALYPAARLLLATRGERKPAFNVPAPGLPSMLHRLIAWYFLMEARLLPHGWWGTSLIAVVDLVEPKLKAGGDQAPSSSQRTSRKR